MAADVASLVLRVDSTQAATAARDLDRLSSASGNADRAARQMSGGFASVGTALKGLVAQLAAVAGIAQLASSFISANVAAERLSKGLSAVFGSATAGAAEMAYVSQAADRLGLSLASTGAAYVSLTAATKGTTLEGQATRDIFESVSLAMGKLGKSSADTEGALNAIQQMISKGKVSAEELRGQLGERLPGAFKLAAEAIGVTTAELDAMLSKGQVVAADLLPSLSQKLTALYDDGKAIGGLEAEWNRLVNALDRMLVSANSATGATSALGAMLQTATAQATAFGEALGVIANWQQGKGFAYGERDNLASDYALRAKLLDEYIVKMKDAKAYLDSNDLDNSAARRAEGEALIARINEIDARTKQVRADVKEARADAEALNKNKASTVGDDAIRLYREHQAAVTENGKAIDALNSKYDKSIAKKAEYAKMESAIAEAVKLGTMSYEEGQAKLAAYAATQDKASESSRSHAKALSAEAQVVADVEQKYGLMKGQLDAVWKLESGRGQTAGTSSERWVKDLAAGEGHMTKIVGQFQMAEGTSRGLGANMSTFNGQADAAGKYLAQAAAQGKTLWEQFAYYHGGPNEKAWGEKTRAYADAAVKIVADATGSMEDLGQNTGKAITDALNKANDAVQNMIRLYLPAEAAAMDYAQSLEYLANSSDFASLSQEKQSIILQGLQRDFEKSKIGATDTANAWAEVWKNAVKRIDDTFAGLWKDLFSGTKSTLESMKDAILSWLAEVAHALLTKPLVVAITTAMTGATGVAGAAGQAASGVSGVSGIGSGFSNIGSLFSTAFSLGATFLEGAAAGFSALFSGTYGTAMSFAGAGIASGTGAGIAGGLGALMPIALPLMAGAFAIFSKWQKDQEPRYGAYGATTTGRSDQFEGGVSAKGAFGLTFGMNDLGTANVDPEEQRALLEGFAKVSNVLADFYGKDVEAAVKASLAKASMENWGKNGLMNYAANAEQAFQIAFTDIIKHAAATGDAVAVVMSSVVGSLQGTMEEMASQIERGMIAAKAAVGMAEALQGQEGGTRLGLSDNDTLGNALKLVEYANAMKASGETTAEALGRMAVNLTVLDGALTLTGTKTEATGMVFVELANSLAKAADDAGIGMAGLAQLQAAYYENFFTEEERALKQKEDATKAIKKWNKDQGLTGDSEIKDSAGLRKYIESLDLTTEAGQKAYVSAMQIVVAFMGLDAALKILGETSLVSGDQIKTLAEKIKDMDDLINQLDPTTDMGKTNKANEAKNELDKYGYKGDYSGESIAKFLEYLKQFSNGLKIGGEDLLKFTEGLLYLAEIAEKKADMEATILGLTKGPEAEQAARRKMELAAMDASLRPLQERIWKLQDEAEATRKLGDFMDWLTNGAYSAAGAQARVADAFKKMGIEMPATKEALEALYKSGKLTAAQLKILSDILDDLKIVYPDDPEPGGKRPGDPGYTNPNAVGGSAISGGGEATRESKIPELELQLLELIEGAWAATLKQRETELAALTEEEAVLQQQIWALEDAARVRELEIQLMEAQGKSWEATLAQRELELKSLSDAEQAIKKAIWAQEDANTLRDLEWQLMEAQGRSWEVTIAKREQELLGMSEEQQALQKLVWAQEDANQVRNMEIELLNAQGKSWEATLMQRELELQSLSEEEQALQKLIWAQEDANKIQELNIQLLEAQGRTEEALQAQRALQLLAMSEEEQAIQQTIWALQDETAAREEQLNLQIRLANVMGNAALALQIQRQMELAAVTNAASRALLLMIYSLEDAQALAGQATNSGSEAEPGLDLNATGVSNSSDSNPVNSVTDEVLKALEELVASLQKLSSSIKSTIESLFPQAPTDIIMRREIGEMKIREALIAAKNGNIPKFEDLEDALKAVGKTEDKQFATREAYLRRMGQTRADLTELDKIVGDRLTTEEKILEALKAAPNETGTSAGMNVGAAVNPGIEDLNDKTEILIKLASLINDSIAAIDTNNDDAITFEELLTALGGVATEESLLAYFETLDKNNDGVISALESLPLSFAISLKPMFETLDENVDGNLTYAELESALGSVMNGEQISAMIELMDADKNGMISALEASTFELEKISTQQQQLDAITEVAEDTSQMNDQLDSISDSVSDISSDSNNILYAINAISSSVAAIAENTALSAAILWAINLTNASQAAGEGFATGGISSGSATGYQALLHGTEAVIPLGDGNSITAHLTAPLPNYIASEAGDSGELRSALAELQAELAAMRGDQQIIGAATVGELKDHNKRERKRDVVPQVIEVAV